MKKLFYSFAILSLVFTACNPLEDLHQKIDAQQKIITGEVKFELSDADYETLKLSYKNFSTIDVAKTALPGFLANKYPVWGKSSLAEVIFKVYAPKTTEKSLESYTVSSADYKAEGHKYGNFSSATHITTFLDKKYPNPADRLLVSLTYKYYSGSVATLNNGFLYTGGKWQTVTGFTSDEYKQMGESYPNFSSKEEAVTKTPIFLLDKFKFASKKAGDVEGIMYKVYNSGTRKTESFVAYFIFGGTVWSTYNNVVNETVKFGHDGTKWVPDNTVKYTLTNADYKLVGNDRYNNFDVRAGKDEEAESVRIIKVSQILVKNFPGAAEGQKYIVSYNIYNGADGVWELAVIKTGGKYVKQ